MGISGALDPAFKPLLDDKGLTQLDTAHSTTYGIWPDFRLAYTNPGWFRFARDESGEPEISRDWKIGASILDAMAADIQPFYAGMYIRCLQEGRVWEHDYECSSASRYRRFHQLAYPLASSAGLLIVNAILVDREHDGLCVQANAEESEYKDADGLL
ncbi:MAG: hypothetical protein Q9M30_09210, partial [Mariprofundaceae bacterium]|nr:hypothetical protein [Mariprofundaceae bacterium]